jgi:hypothetical protein
MTSQTGRKTSMAWILRTILTAALVATPALADKPSMPGWLTGCWSQENGSSWTEECWSGPRGGIMLGGGRTGRGDMLQSWEMMQIQQAADGSLTFYGQPRGGPRVAFPAISANDREIIFANARHDYPQRIRYWREGMDLNAEVSLANGGNATSWHYKRQMR